MSFSKSPKVEVNSRLEHSPNVLSVQNLAVTFSGSRGKVFAVKDVSLEVPAGSAVGILGESGSGKSVATLAILGLLDERTASVHGTAEFLGRDLLKLRNQQLRCIRGREIGIVFQDPLSSLNPALRVETQIVETLKTHLGLDKHRATQRALELLDMVEITRAKDRLKSYPHELSGGMRQRVMIAIAISCQPRLLIADEPTTALDVTVQAQILETLRRLIKDTQMSLLLITHDIGVISEICENVAVLYAGRTVESLPLSNFLNSPTSCHPYSEALLNSRVFQVDQRGRRLSAIPGSPPDPNTEFVGCSFAPRCSYTTQKCHDKNPELKIIAPTHLMRCWERK